MFRAIPRVRKFVFMDTKRAQDARNQQLTTRQRGVVIGSLLGDGYLVATTRGFAFRVNHSVRQKEYVDWKHSELESFTNSSPKQYGKSYYFRTVSHDFFRGLRQVFYNGAQKILPSRVDAWINPLVFSVWLMDDGAKDKGQLRLNTQSFSRQENERLIRVLKAKLGIVANLNRDKDRFRLRVQAVSMPRVRRITVPHIIPSMQYKLSL